LASDPVDPELNVGEGPRFESKFDVDVVDDPELNVGEGLKLDDVGFEFVSFPNKFAN
jgi:hypothetical protein